MNHEIENIVLHDDVAKEDYDTSMNTTWQSNNKRGPTTPLAASKQTNSRRKLVQHKREINMISFSEVNKKDYIEMCYQNWLMKRNLDRNEEIVKFLEMERKFTLEDH